MTLTSGCGNKTPVRPGGGNIKSLVVILSAGIVAYLMTDTGLTGWCFAAGCLLLAPA